MSETYKEHGHPPGWENEKHPGCQACATENPVADAPPCSDCGKPSVSPLLMNTSVGNDYRYLCQDCWEEDFDGIMQEPCPRCHGSGTEWEGWDCEECRGDGISIY